MITHLLLMYPLNSEYESYLRMDVEYVHQLVSDTDEIGVSIFENCPVQGMSNLFLRSDSKIITGT